VWITGAFTFVTIYHLMYFKWRDPCIFSIKKLKVHTNPDKLIKDISEGDERAFAAFFDFYYSKSYAYAYNFSRSQTDAEEIVQESFLRVWLARDKLTGIDNVESWVFKIVSRECLSLLKRRVVRRNYILELTEDKELTYQEAGVSPADLIELEEMQGLVAQVIGKMPAQRKRIYKMSREEGKKPAEIAAQLALSVSTVKNTLSLALKEIRAALSISDIELLIFLLAFTTF
jgi:RNA polymerase sigma-70 factor (family 1)